MSNGSVVMRGNCPFLVGNTAADPLFAALDRSNALSLFLLDISSVAGGRIRRVGTVASRGARGVLSRR